MPLLGVQASKSNHLTHIVKVGKAAIFGHDFGGSDVAQSGNRSQQFLLSFEIRILVDMVLNLFFNVSNLLLKKINLGLQIIHHRFGWVVPTTGSPFDD